MSIEQYPTIHRPRRAMQIRNDDDRKLETFGLMNCHQTNGIGSLIDLTFTFATTDGFEFLDVAHKVANQMRARAFESFREGEKPLDICEPLRPVKRRGNHGQVFRLLDCEPQQIPKTVMMPPRNQ